MCDERQREKWRQGGKKGGRRIVNVKKKLDEGEREFKGGGWVLIGAASE